MCIRPNSWHRQEKLPFEIQSSILAHLVLLIRASYARFLDHNSWLSVSLLPYKAHFLALSSSACSPTGPRIRSHDGMMKPQRKDNNEIKATEYVSVSAVQAALLMSSDGA